MAADHTLALDAGTSGARGVVAKPGAGVVAVARREWRYETPPEIAPLGRAFDSEAFWSVICGVARDALAKAGLSAGDIAAVGVTSQRLAVVIIDGEGRALYAGPNLDARAVGEGFAIDARLAGRVYDSCGKLPSLLLAAAKAQWLRKRDEAGFARAAAVFSMGDWIAHRLTGELRAEPSLSADCGLLDVTTRARDEALMAALDVPAALLPPLVTPQEVAGRVTPAAGEAAGLAPGTPVVIAGSDTQCALLGMGVIEPGEVGIAAGWSCPLMQVTAEPRIDPQRRTWTSVHVVPERWVVESSATDAGRTWRWWSETLLGEGDATLGEAAALAAQAPPASRDVLALLGPAAMNAGAMGLHLGGILMHTPLSVGAVGRPELLRAILENIAFALRANLEQAEEVTGLAATRIALGGGLTQAAPFPRIVADALGRPVEVAREVDVTGLGAARLAAEAVGLPADGLVPPVERIEPEAGVSETYRRAYERWRRLGVALDATMEG